MPHLPGVGQLTNQTLKRFLLSIVTLLALQGIAIGQFVPQAGLPGSTAINYTDSRFTGWATQCVVQRGYMDIANPAGGYASLGDSSLAIGIANHTTVSLGDSGVATLTFASPIYDGPGADFAIFENGFIDGANDSLAFLELAFVEVSSDSVNYFRFPATSNTQQNVQLTNDDYVNASALNNLAGKYIGMYGTPFDLSELEGTTGLDINNITHVRIIDVVGSIGAHASHDINGRAINDPYPTAFASGGFDLDAVGVLHQTGNASVATVANHIATNIYPNPVTNELHISIQGAFAAGTTATITTITGNVLLQVTLTAANTIIPVAAYPAGMYYIQFRDANGNTWVEKIAKY